MEQYKKEFKDWDLFYFNFFSIDRQAKCFILQIRYMLCKWSTVILIVTSIIILILFLNNVIWIMYKKYKSFSSDYYHKYSFKNTLLLVPRMPKNWNKRIYMNLFNWLPFSHEEKFSVRFCRNFRKVSEI